MVIEDDDALAQAVDLLAIGRELLAVAAGSASGRAARNLLPGSGRHLTQTLLAITAGSALADHTAPGPATLQVLRGEGVVTGDGHERTVEAGRWIRLPDERHGLRAVDDLVCLLTVGVATALGGDGDPSV